MHPLNRLFASQRRSGAEICRATIASRLTDGDYYCDLVDTGARVRASRGNVQTELTVGQLVLLGGPDANYRSVNTGYVILGYPPGAAKGASGAPALTETATRSGSSISRIVPAICQMTGGQTTAIDIYGTGFTAAPTYGSDKLTNVDAPVVTSTHIHLVVKALSSLAAGDYSLAVGNDVRADYFQISYGYQARLWTLHGSPTKALHKIDPSTGLEIASAAGPSARARRGLTGGGDNIYTVDDEGISVFDAETLAATLFTASIPLCDALGQAAYLGGSIFYATSTGNVAKVRASDGVLLGTLPASGASCCFAAGGYIWSGQTSGANTIWKIDPVTLTLVQNITTGYPAHYLATDGTFIYAASNIAAGRVAKIDMATGDVALNVALPANSWPWGLAVLGNYLYVAESGLLLVSKRQISDLAEVANIGNASASFWLQTDTSDGTIAGADYYCTEPGHRRHVRAFDAGLTGQAWDLNAPFNCDWGGFSGLIYY